MGRVEITIAVGDPQGNRFEELEVLVDTGATFTKVPRELLERLEVSVERSVMSELADGRTVPRDIGLTTIRLEGQELLTPVIFGEQGERPLLGVIALEHALLDVDPTNRRLVPTNLLELRTDNRAEGKRATTVGRVEPYTAPTKTFTIVCDADFRSLAGGKSGHCGSPYRRVAYPHSQVNPHVFQ